MLCFYIFIILQIVVESFPVSSSGHVHIFLMMMQKCGVSLPAYTMSSWFNHLLHIPTIVILTLFYYKTWLSMLLHPWRYRYIIARAIGIAFVADCMMAFSYIFFVFYLVNTSLIGIGFVITALALYSLRYVPLAQKQYSLMWVACILGIAQGAAVLPGISRFGITYVVARWCGYRAERSFALSWMIVYPAFCVAALHGIVTLGFIGIPTELLQPVCVVSILGATVIAWYALWYVYNLALRNTLWHVSTYMVIPFALWIALLFL